MRPVITGLVLAGVLLSAAVLTPSFLRSSADVAATVSTRQAENALAEFHDADLILSLAAARSQVEDLRQADAAALFSRAEADFQALGQQFQGMVRDAQTSDRKQGQKAGALRTVSLDPGALGSLISGFEKHEKENANLLSAAGRAVGEAARASDRVWLAAHVQGLVRLTECTTALANARVLRASVDSQAERVIAELTEWRVLSAEKARVAGLDSTELDKAIADATEQARSDSAQIGARLAQLESEVNARSTELGGVRAELARQREALIALEQESFKPGQDASFQAYRTRYVEISRQLDALQRREQLLALGGISEAAFADDDVLAGEIKGGEAVLGLNELERQLAAAQGEQKRLTATLAELDARKTAAQKRGEAATSSVASIEAMLGQLTQQLNASLDALLTTATEASAREEEAVRAVSEASRAFRSAKSILDRTASDARKLASDYDKQGKNERLKIIQRGAEFGELLGTGAEAQAKAMLGRAQAERLAALLTLEDLLARVSAAIPDAPQRAESLAEQRDAARTAAAEALSAAAADYEKLAQRGPQAARWISQAALAGVAVLQSQVDSANEAQHRVTAAQAIRTAVEGRQQSPYLSGHVLGLYALLSGEAPASAPAEGDSAPTSPAGEEESNG